MTRTTGTKATVNFSKGLNTQASALAFPQDACTEVFNCVVDRTGAVERRLGFEVEVGGSDPSTTSTTTGVMVEYLWSGVGGIGSKSFVVQQHGCFIRFYNVSTSMVPSAHRETFTVDLNSYRPGSPTIDPSLYPCSFDQGDGKLFIANRGINPVYVTYDASGNSITVTTITVKEKDFYGAPEMGWDLQERYTGTVAALIAADPNHYYNLLNQGWHTSLEDGSTPATAPLISWDTGRADLPSNADTPWLYLNTVSTITDVFQPAVIPYRGPGTVLASKGHFILDVFTPSRTAATANYNASYQATVTGDRTDDKERFQCISFFSGRVFYAGTNSSDLNTKIFFSRIVEKTDHYAQCYQDNDPTTKDLVDLLPSDGGVIRIPEIDQIIRLYSFRTTLLVFATNGVWAISGSAGQGFRANDYVVKKLSSLGQYARLSFIDFKGTPIWWGENGVMTIKYDPNYDSFTVENITFDSIWSFYHDIPIANKAFVKGAYDARNDIAYWVYRNATGSSTTNYTYDRVMCMNGWSGAFYPWSFDTTTKLIRGIIYVIEADGNGIPSIKYTTTEPVDSTHEKLTYSGETSTTYLDWITDDYSSYFITGWAVDGEAQRFFQGNYVWVYFNTIADSSCFLQGLYDFTNSSSSGKWSTVQQLYNSSLTYRDINHRRLKIRGKGKALQLKFTSETGKPYNIAGWTLWETQNASI